MGINNFLRLLPGGDPKESIVGLEKAGIDGQAVDLEAQHHCSSSVLSRTKKSTDAETTLAL